MPTKIVCSRRIDKGGPGRASNTVTCVFFNRPGGVVLCSSVVAFWTTILKDTDSNSNVLDNRVPVSVFIFFSHVVLRKSEK